MAAERAIQVLVVDDNPAIRRSLARLFAFSNGIEVAGEAAQGDEAVDLVRANEYDVVILDLQMPGRHGLEILADLKREWPALPVIVLSVEPPSQYEKRALALGAAGYVTKSCAADDLIDMVYEATKAHG